MKNESDKMDSFVFTTNLLLTKYLLNQTPYCFYIASKYYTQVKNTTNAVFFVHLNFLYGLFQKLRA